MEFPNLGTHCGVSTCKQLDFLPMKCDACSQVFCRDHITYSTHTCAESYKKDNQVPVCPLCNKLIPLMPGELPDVKVGRHIDTDCQSDPAKERRKVYTNKCSHKGCKTKELVPVRCDKCQKNFCLKHRNELDHECKGFEGTSRAGTKAGASAASRARQSYPSASSSSSGKPSTSKPPSRPQQTTMAAIGRDLNRERQGRQNAPQRPAQSFTPQSIQGGLSEDEAMARAMQESMAQNERHNTGARPMTRQEEEDLMIAQALAASEQEQATQQQSSGTRGRRRRRSNQEKSCAVS